MYKNFPITLKTKIPFNFSFLEPHKYHKTCEPIVWLRRVVKKRLLCRNDGDIQSEMMIGL